LARGQNRIFKIAPNLVYGMVGALSRGGVQIQKTNETGNAFGSIPFF
jgi:hypothetical protein